LSDVILLWMSCVRLSVQFAFPARVCIHQFCLDCIMFVWINVCCIWIPLSFLWNSHCHIYIIQFRFCFNKQNMNLSIFHFYDSKWHQKTQIPLLYGYKCHNQRLCHCLVERRNCMMFVSLSFSVNQCIDWVLSVACSGKELFTNLLSNQLRFTNVVQITTFWVSVE